VTTEDQIQVRPPSPTVEAWAAMRLKHMHEEPILAGLTKLCSDCPSHAAPAACPAYAWALHKLRTLPETTIDQAADHSRRTPCVGHAAQLPNAE
jgi:hypothetical protein